MYSRVPRARISRVEAECPPAFSIEHDIPAVVTLGPLPVRPGDFTPQDQHTHAVLGAVRVAPALHPIGTAVGYQRAALVAKPESLRCSHAELTGSLSKIGQRAFLEQCYV